MWLLVTATTSTVRHTFGNVAVEKSRKFRKKGRMSEADELTFKIYIIINRQRESSPYKLSDNTPKELRSTINLKCQNTSNSWCNTGDWLSATVTHIPEVPPSKQLSDFRPIFITTLLLRIAKKRIVKQ